MAAILLTGLFSCEEEITDNTLPCGEVNHITPTVVTASAEAPEVSELIVEFTDELADQLIENASADTLGAEAIHQIFVGTRSGLPTLESVIRLERVFPDAGKWEARHREAGLHRWFKLSYSEPVTQTRAAGELREIPGVTQVEAIPRMKRCAVNLPFNDPYGKRYQWHLYNDGSLAKGFVSGCDINVVPVWENYGAGSPEVIVAVVDDGIYYEHPDLKGVVMAGGPGGSKNFVDNSYNIVAGDHGTHVAGIIGAINNNATGTCGIAGGMDGKGGVRLMSYQIFQDNPNDPKHPYNGNSAAAIVWGADNGAVICQNSWGYDYDTEEQAKYGQTPQSMKRAIDYFRANAGTDENGNQTGPMRGGIVIFAAGNEGWAYGQPGDYPPVIAVGATGPDGLKATYSNYGDWVDICAPGGEYQRISANGLAYIMSLATNKGGSYVWMCGTSMACPMVSGVAALAVSILGGSGFTNEMLEEMLLRSANPDIIPAEDRIGPMVDAFKTIDDNLREKVFFQTDYTGNYSIATVEDLTVDYAVTDKDNNRFTILLDSDGSAELASSSSNSCSIHFNATEANVGTHKARITARRVDNTSGSLDLTYTIYVNQAPEIHCEAADGQELKWFERPKAVFRASDPEGRTDLDWDLQCSPEGAATMSVEGAVATVTLGTGKGDLEGNCKVILTVRDPIGAATSSELGFKVLANQPPVVVKSFDNILLTGNGDRATLSIQDYFSDPDGEALTYSYAVSEGSVASMTNAGYDFFIRSGQEGLTPITVTAKDGLGKSCSAQFLVGVYNDTKGPTAYPNPVRDVLNIRIGAPKEIQVQVYSEMGELLLDQKGTSSIFQQMTVNMSNLAPGRYLTRILIDGNRYDKQIVKI